MGASSWDVSSDASQAFSKIFFLLPFFFALLLLSLAVRTTMTNSHHDMLASLLPTPTSGQMGARDASHLKPQVCYSTYMFFYTLLKITLQPKTKWIQQRWQGVNRGSRHDVSWAPGMFFIIHFFYCLLNDHQQHHCFVFCFFFHCSASVAWVLFY